ncbi:MAG: hypothetical protein JWN48_1863 [Myxococcaceae bacterium]|nr:hypothetical protein [Myxococcaceae bacterium]
MQVRRVLVFMLERLVAMQVGIRLTRRIADAVLVLMVHVPMISRLSRAFTNRRLGVDRIVLRLCHGASIAAETPIDIRRLDVALSASAWRLRADRW